LVASDPQPGKVVEESTSDELGLTRWKLDNGITLLLKSTDFKNDEIIVRGWRPGGHSLALDEQYISASMADGVISAMGAGNFSRIELGKALAGKVASVQSSISERSEGIRASASPKDLETMFQLLYLKFTGARRDDEAFQAWLTKTEGWLENQEASPRYVFGRTFSETINQKHPRRLHLSAERLKQFDLDDALAFYRERFADASGFVFTIVGNFELETIRPLVEKWLGGLPAIDRENQWLDVGVEAPDGVVEFDVHKGIEQKSSVRIVFHGPAEWSPLNQHLLGSTAEVMRIRLREVLREDMGGVYGVSVYGGISRYPKQEYSFTVSFGCDPERATELAQAVFDEIETLKKDGPGNDYIDKVRESQTRSRETNLERNGFWASTLLWHERNELDLLEILRYDELVAAVTGDSILEAARRYLDDERYVHGVLYPEEAAADEELPEAAAQ
jgi:zinc protease